MLVEDLGLVPGNRVLLRAANTPMMVAAYLAVIRAGGIAVGTMPLLRASELKKILAKAEISHALCDLRLKDELERARAAAPVPAPGGLLADAMPPTAWRRGWRPSRRPSRRSTARPTTSA